MKFFLFFGKCNDLSIAKYSVWCNKSTERSNFFSKNSRCNGVNVPCDCVEQCVTLVLLLVLMCKISDIIDFYKNTSS